MRASLKLLIFVSIVVVTPSWVQVPAARAQWGGARGGGPCREDMEKFCKDVPPGRGKARECMQEHLADLSPDCRAQLQATRKGAGRGALQTACSADADKFCKELKPGQGGLYHCLKGHESELSEGCKTAITGGQPPAGR
jgi:hypothetical protein